MDDSEESCRPPRLKPMPSNPADRLAHTVHPVRPAPPPPSMLSTSADPNDRLQHEIVEAQNRVFNEINACQMTFSGSQADGLTAETLSLWDHASQHVPNRNEETFESVRNHRAQVEAQQSALDAFERNPATASRLDRSRTQRSDDSYRETVKKIAKFLETNPSAIVDLQAEGLAFDTVSHASLADARSVPQAADPSPSTGSSLNTREEQPVPCERDLSDRSCNSNLQENENIIRILETDMSTPAARPRTLQVTPREEISKATVKQQRQVTALRSESYDLQDEITRKNFELERQDGRIREFQKTADNNIHRAERNEGTSTQLRLGSTDTQQQYAMRIESLSNDLDIAEKRIQDLTVAVQAHIRESASLSEPFLRTRRQPSVCVHGLTRQTDIVDVRRKTLDMFVACQRIPCRIELEDIYSVDRRLNEVSHSDRTSALLLLLAILRMRAIKLQASYSKPFAASLFILHILHVICAWSGDDLIASLQLKDLFEASVKCHLDDHPIVSHFAAMLVKVFEGHDDLSLGTSLRNGNLPNTIERGGYAYIPIADDILICTPEGDVVYAHTTQYSAQAPGPDDLVAELSSFRLVFAQLPLLGNFKSVWWSVDLLEDSASDQVVLNMGLERLVAGLELSPPPEHSLRLYID